MNHGQVKTPEQHGHLVEAAKTLHTLIGDCCGFRAELPKGERVDLVNITAAGVRGVCRRCYHRRIALQALESAGDYDRNLDRLGLRR